MPVVSAHFRSAQIRHCVLTGRRCGDDRGSYVFIADERTAAANNGLARLRDAAAAAAAAAS